MIVSIRIPQMGEGLQEALLVDFLKKAGDDVRRDEPLYVMETDKATTDVESPYTGKLIAWTVSPGTVLPIGAEIGKMEVDEAVKEMPSGHGPAGTHSGQSSMASASTPATSSADSAEESDSGSSGSSVVIPPKTRKYLKDLGLLEVADQIPCSGKKLMPEDVDAFLANRPAGQTTAGQAVTGSGTAGEFDLVAIPKSQISLNYRLTRSAQTVVPVTLVVDIDWSAIMAAREAARGDGGPTGFAMACYAVVQAMKEHSKFRSSMNAEGNALKVYRRVNLGVAVALPGDEMVTAVIRSADEMSPQDFFAAYQDRVNLARDGKDQADESTTLVVSNIGKVGMRIGIPAIVSPAVATLAIGEVYQAAIPDGAGYRFRPTVTATMSFDHRIANGVGAANFLNDIRYRIEQYSANP